MDLKSTSPDEPRICKTARHRSENLNSSRDEGGGGGALEEVEILLDLDLVDLMEDLAGEAGVEVVATAEGDVAEVVEPGGRGGWDLLEEQTKRFPSWEVT